MHCVLRRRASRKQKTGVRIVLDNPTQPVSRLAPPRTLATVGDNSPWVSQPLSGPTISVMIWVSIGMLCDEHFRSVNHHFECTFVLEGTNIPFPPEYFGVASGTGPLGVGCCAGDCTSKTASNIEP